ncbi:nucleotidyltransferase family protein [Algirhabdus cladophorae]|uniref:nucleotidyltransferase family protein n=1 Tax=Algirhabdus cladophorae TaxID=3377108 RepID=UPI003B847F6C
MQTGHACVADLAILLPAAGASSRMQGADKLLQDVDGQPCLRHMARRALQASDHVIVTLPALDHPRASALQGLHVTAVPVPDWADGMSASLKAGVTHAKDAKALMIVPADMPDITGQDIATLAAVFRASGLAVLQGASADGQAGHPVIFHRKTYGDFHLLSGDKGAAAVIKRHAKSHALYPLSGTRALLDLDSPQDWAAWRKSR